MIFLAVVHVSIVCENKDLHPYEHLLNSAVVVYQCSSSNVIVTWDTEALLYSKVHSVLECCVEHTRCFIEPIQFLPHPGLDYSRFTHTLWHSTYKCLSTTYSLLRSCGRRSTTGSRRRCRTCSASPQPAEGTLS